MADDSMALLDTLRKATEGGDVDVLRELARVALPVSISVVMAIAVRIASGALAKTAMKLSPTKLTSVPPFARTPLVQSDPRRARPNSNRAVVAGQRPSRMPSNSRVSAARSGASSHVDSIPSSASFPMPSTSHA